MKSKPIVYVQGAQRMVTRARLIRRGLMVAFADEQEVLVPYADLRLRSTATRISLPDPHIIEISLLDGRTVRVGWEVARRYADPAHQHGSVVATDQNWRDQPPDRRRALGGRIRSLRSLMGISQKELADLSGINRVTIARLEAGTHSPRYQTIRALADALGRPCERLIAPLTPRG